MKEYQKCAKEMLEFIEKSPTCFQAVGNLKAALEKQGFSELRETEEWNLESGQGYFVTRNDSSLIAFRMPEFDVSQAFRTSKAEKAKKESAAEADGNGKRIAGFHMIASHSDSPSFKIKESPEIAMENTYLKLNTEKYGGMILTTWFDRALSVAGRVVVKGKEGVETRLVNIEEDLLVIPSLAIHMGKIAEYNPQVDLLPLYADCTDGKRKNVLMKHGSHCNSNHTPGTSNVIHSAEHTIILCHFRERSAQIRTAIGKTAYNRIVDFFYLSLIFSREISYKIQFYKNGMLRQPLK